jgi:hypothetical protein
MKPGMVVYTHNPSPGEAEAGRLWVWREPGLHSETMRLYLVKTKACGHSSVVEHLPSMYAQSPGFNPTNTPFPCKNGQSETFHLPFLYKLYLMANKWLVIRNFFIWKYHLLINEEEMRDLQYYHSAILMNIFIIY